MAEGPCSSAGLRYIGTVWSVVACVVFGLSTSFNTYSLELKHTFNLTQTQVEIVSSMGTAGLALGCLGSAKAEFHGHPLLEAGILFLMPTVGIVYSLAAWHRDIFCTRPTLICLVQLVLAACCSMAFVIVSRNLAEFYKCTQRRHIVSATAVASSAGKIFYGGLMDLFFKDRLEGFFLTIAGACGVMFGGSLVFRKLLLPLNSGNDDIQDDVKVEVPEKIRLSSTQIFSLSTIFIFWTSCGFYACGYALLNNVTAVAHSLRMPNPLVAVYVAAITIIISRLVFAEIYHRFPSHLCGLCLLCLSCVSFIIGLVFVLSHLTGDSVIVMTVLCALGSASGDVIPTSIISRQMDQMHYVTVYIAFCILTTIVQILVQVLIGLAYDSQKAHSGVHEHVVYCYGGKCFLVLFWTFLCLAAIAFISQFINCVVVYFKHRNDKSNTDVSHDKCHSGTR